MTLENEVLDLNLRIQENGKILTELATTHDQLEECAAEIAGLVSNRDRLTAAVEGAHQELTETQARLRSLEGTLASQQQEMARANIELADQKAAVAALEEAMAESQKRSEVVQQELAEQAQDSAQKMRDRIQLLEEHARNLARERDDAQRTTHERHAELVQITRLLQEQIRASDLSVKQVEWLRQIHATLIGTPDWWRFFPTRKRRKWEASRLNKHGLFNGERYLDLHPDVRNAGMDPLFHYIQHGMLEGRRRD